MLLPGNENTLNAQEHSVGAPLKKKLSVCSYFDAAKFSATTSQFTTFHHAFK